MSRPTYLKTWLLRYTRPGSSRCESTSAKSRVFQPKGFGVWCCCGRSSDACRPPVASNAASLPTPCSLFCGCSPMLAAVRGVELDRRSGWPQLQPQSDRLRSRSAMLRGLADEGIGWD
jgi:hypothetical protein